MRCGGVRSFVHPFRSGWFLSAQKVRILSSPNITGDFPPFLYIQSAQTETRCRSITFSTLLHAPKAWRQHTAAHTGDKNPESKYTSHRYKRHVNCRSHGTNVVYLDCQLDRCRLTEHLRGTRESEQKKIFIVLGLKRRMQKGP